MGKTLRLMVGLFVLSGCSRAPATSESAPSSTAPVFPHFRAVALPICNVLRSADYVVEAEFVSAGKPYILELSPWPGTPMWVTPIEWKVVHVIATRPLPGATLASLGTAITTIVAAEVSKPLGTAVFGATLIDGKLVSDPWPIVSTSAGWRSPVVREVFAADTELAQAIAAASTDPACAREDFMEATRVANVERLAEALAHPPTKILAPQASGPRQSGP